MLLLKKEQKSQQDAKVCYICGKRFIKNMLKKKIIVKSEIVSIILINKERWKLANVRFNVPQ